MIDTAPPQDLDAERAVLGVCLTLGRVPDDCPPLQPADFYLPSHEQVWQAIGWLTERNRPCDAVTVGAALTDRGLLDNIGLPYLHTLLASPPAVGSIVYYADIVRDRAIRRFGIQASAENAQDFAESSDDAVTVLARAEARLAKAPVAEQDDVSSLLSFSEFLNQKLPNEEWVIPGLLSQGDRLILTGNEGLGKALALDTPLPTPTGWTSMGKVKVGDQVLGADGHPALVTFATDVQWDRDCYAVTFSDGSRIVADADHLWPTETLLSREATARASRRPAGIRPRGTNQQHKRVHWPAAVTTAHIRDTLRARHVINHAIPAARPLVGHTVETAIDPYVLGAWLGDGHTDAARITVADPEIVARIAETESIRRVNGTPYTWGITSGRGGKRTTFQARLRAEQVLGVKRIPERFLRADYGQRLALLQGLMDTDGTVAFTGRTPICEFSVCHLALAEDVRELVHTFGIKTTMRSGDAKIDGRVVGTRWRLSFQTDLPVFHLPRKAERLRPLRTRRARLRYITAVEPVPSVPVRCIQVDSADHLYLAGDAMIPTHNTTLVRQMAACIAAGVQPFTGAIYRPRTVLYIDCENPNRLMINRFQAMARAIDLHRREVPDGNLWIDRQPDGLDLIHDPQAVRWLRRRLTATNPDVLVIGPIYKLHNGTRPGESDETQAKALSAVLDRLREEFGCALILEAHSAKGEPGQTRPVTPIGSSLWLRWPEFGYGLRPVARKDVPVAVAERERLCEFVAWKKRDERDWPRHLMSSGSMPWVETVV